MSEYYGKYRGKVEGNADTTKQGLIEVSVPGVLDGKVWAWPSVPFAGPNIGFFAIPPVGANVWVEFEGGDTEKSPIWSGCFWDLGQAPASVSPGVLVIKTQTCTLTMSELQQNAGITIETTAGMKIQLGATDIEITDGKGGTIKLTGPKVSINGSALEVT